MILHDSRAMMRLPEFGVAIPALDSRPLGILEALRGHSVLGPLERRWLKEPGGGTVVGRDDLVRAHEPAYVDRVLADPEPALVQALELYDEAGRPHRYDPARARRPLRELLDVHLAHLAGSYDACRLALADGFAFFLGGGMHHAMPAQPGGFCLFNDIVTAIRRLQAEGAVGLAWVADVDAHKGDGTAVMCLGDASILTLSVHMAQGWPLNGPPLDDQGRLRPSFWPSDVDVPVPVGGEEGYLAALTDGLALLERLSWGRRPDLAVVVAGADPYERDELPSARGLRLGLGQMKRRDRTLYDFFHGRGVPQAWLMAGGYGRAAWQPYAMFLQEVLAERLGAGKAD